MNKLITKIIGACLGMSMAAGVGIGVAVGSSKESVRPVEATESELTFNNVGKDLSTTASSTMQTVDLSANETGDYTFNYLQVKKQTSGTNYAMFLVKNNNPFISNHTEMPGEIVSVTLSIMSGASGSTTYDVAFGTSEFTTATAGIGAVNITGGNSHEFENDVTGATYFCITLGNANNGQVQHIKVTYSSGGTPSQWETSAIAISTSESISKTIYNTTTAFPVLSTVSVTKTEHDTTGQAADRNTDVTSSSTLNWVYASDTTQSISLPLANGSYNAKVWASVQGETLTSKDNADSNKKFVSVTLTVTDAPSYVTIAYSGSTTNMTGGNDAAKVGVSATDWSVVGYKNKASNLPGLNTAGQIRLYGNASGGNYISIKASKEGRTISKIVLTTSNSTNFSVFEGDQVISGTPITGVSGTYTFSSNAKAFTIINTNSGTTQVYILSIDVYYSDAVITTPTITLGTTPTHVYVGKTVSFTVDYAALTENFVVSVDDNYLSASYTGAKGTGTAEVILTGVGETNSTTVTVSSTGATSKSFSIEVETAPTYDFVERFSTYASAWTDSYGAHTITSSDLNASIAGTFTFNKAAKASQTITDRPVMRAKDEDSTMLFELDSSLASTKTIDDLTIKFVKWGSDSGTINLYRGNSASGSPVETVSLASATSISISNLNSAGFVLEIVQPSSNSSRLGVTSVDITLENATPFGTLDHIRVTANPTKLIYQSGENFSSSGLTVYAYDGEDETTAESKDVTSSVTLSVAEGYSFLDSDYPNKEITVSYTESTITKTDSFRVEVYTVQSYSLVDTEPSDWSGTYIIVSSLNSEPVALNGALSNIDVVPNYNSDILVESGTALTGQQCQVEIAKTGDGTYSIKTAFGKYIGNKSNSNGISYYNSPADNTITLDSGNAVIKTVGQDTRQLALNANAGQERFRYLQSGESVQLYKLSEPSTATTYANSFLSLLSTGTDHVCDADGKTSLSELQVAWELLAESFADLSAADKALFQKAYANESGTAVEQAVALYDYIATKYNTSLETETLTEYNFMGRNITPAGGNMINKITTNNAVIIVIVISVLSLALFGAFFLLRKKKEVK